jgi:signal transduction histidine kinase
MMVVSVKDEGTGLDEETLKKIFEPFFTTKSADQGTGLGLSVAREIVEDHGGWIDAESSPGQGSTFSMYIPVAS